MDPFYLFVHGKHGQSADDYFYAALTHALLPVLEYLKHLCYRPTIRSDLKAQCVTNFTRVDPLPKTRFANVQCTLTRVLFASISPLYEILVPLAKLTEYNVYRAVASIDVPNNPNHEFWSRFGLQKEDGKYDNGTEATTVTVEILGSTKAEAEAHVMLKLIGFVDEIRRRLRAGSHSLLIMGTLKLQLHLHFTPTSQADAMGWELFQYYRENTPQLLHYPTRQQSWDRVLKLLDKYLEADPSLTPLIAYYKV
jgi:hypothetical protein